ncbi:phage holin family protein [Candidatus Woesebacteria bacterium]|nr:MAG: phage holin family protein [Candidatus Woesebacteria bacterium]
MRIIIKLSISIFALAVVSYLVPGFVFTNVYALIVAAVVIGIINTFIRPVLQIVALPLTIITFGVSAFLINVFLLWLASVLVPGFEITNFFTAVVGSIALSLTTFFLRRLEKNGKN